MNIKTFLLACLLAVFPSLAFAEVCYTSVQTTPKVSVVCNKSDASSADFSNGCRTITEPRYVQMPTACPAQWYWASADLSTPGDQVQAASCAKYGKSPGVIDGHTCTIGPLQNGIFGNKIKLEYASSESTGMHTFFVCVEAGSAQDWGLNGSGYWDYGFFLNYVACQ